jgi:hypothetical protein
MAEAGHPTAKQIAEKEKEHKASVEASQRQASLVREVAPGDATQRVNATLSAPDPDVSTLAGYAVPAEAEKDVDGSITRVYYDGPSLDANVITPADNSVATTEIWEALYQNNAAQPTFVLRAGVGQKLKVTKGNWLMMNDFGPY